MGIRQAVISSPLYDFLGKRSYAQAGEDIVAWSELNKIRHGFYVDIGAFHPKQFSNTYFFYKRGWRGVVVEPNSEMVRLYKKIRKRDTAIGVGVGKEDSLADYFIFDHPAVNTFDPDTAELNQEVGRRLLETKPVAILTLEKVLTDYLPKGEEVDLLSVDTEGMDEEVLTSNNWERFRPRVVICEDLTYDWKNPRSSRVAKLMMKLGYRLFGMTPYSLLFKDKSLLAVAA